MKEKSTPLYRSDYESTFEEWVTESNQLLTELQEHLTFYTQQIQKYQETKDDFMIKFLCLKLKHGNERLEMEIMIPSNKVE